MGRKTNPHRELRICVNCCLSFYPTATKRVYCSEYCRRQAQKSQKIRKEQENKKSRAGIVTVDEVIEKQKEEYEKTGKWISYGQITERMRKG